MRNFQISAQNDAANDSAEVKDSTSATPHVTPGQRVAQRRVATTGMRTGTVRRVPVHKEYDSTESDEVRMHMANVK
jgi:hypothetical protein